MSHQFVGDHSRLDEFVPLLQRVNELASFETAGLTVYLDAVDYSDRHQRIMKGHIS